MSKPRIFYVDDTEDNIDNILNYMDNKKIKYSPYYSPLDLFIELEAKFQLEQVYEERFKKLSKKLQKDCLEELIEYLDDIDGYLDNEYIISISDAILGDYEYQQNQRIIMHLRKKKKKK